MSLFVLDFGGTSIKYGVWEKEILTSKGSVTTPASWEKMKIVLKSLKDVMAGTYSIEGVAISAPGAVNQKRGVIEGASAIPYIHHFPIFKELEELFECPVAMENDANCAGLAEVWLGAAKDYHNVLFVVIGSGIGGAIIIDKKVWHGKHLFGGEFGFMLLNGKQTFSELGTAVHMAKRTEKRKGLPEGELDGKAVFRLAEQGDPVAAEEVEKFYHYLAQGIYNLQYCFDPEKIIIGGGISGKEDLIPQLNKKLQEIVDQVGIAPFVPDIALCKFKNDANLIGAVYNYKIVYG